MALCIFPIGITYFGATFAMPWVILPLKSMETRWYIGVRDLVSPARPHDRGYNVTPHGAEDEDDLRAQETGLLLPVESLHGIFKHGSFGNGFFRHGFSRHGFPK